MKDTPFSPQRRRALQALALATLTPRYAFANIPANPDVVIVGAGAAGLAAAKTFRQRGINYVVLEAANRIGGRCYTDMNVFGVPYDMGAHWLHIRHLNPLVDYAIDNGFDVYPSPDKWKLYVGDRKARDDEVAEAEETFALANRSISRAGEHGRDISARDAVGESFFIREWGPTMAAAIGPWEMGKDLDDFSCVDWWSGADGKDWFCKQGYGSVLAHYGKDVPVELGTAVEKIRWDGDGVAVQTRKGLIKAKAVIVTVSTGVLAKQHIRFEPGLSVEKQASFDAIEMGTYNNIALHFSENVFAEGDDVYVNNRYHNEETIGFLTNISDSHLVFGYVGGRFGAELEATGVESSVDFALNEVKKMLGSDVEKKYIKGATTRWGKMHLTEGSYASAKPGMYSMRRILREPVADRIYFAGEACHESLWATVGGALESGSEVAERVAEKSNV